ncbi:hypothetical protein [Ornithinimicrobium kibberense]|uniref:hypothetical protein n=1 Tax=Ornithinimicrobium kibberense TaxID=282060 RepID=UPI00362208E8
MILPGQPAGRPELPQRLAPLTSPVVHDTEGLPDAGHPPSTLGGRLRVGQRPVEVLCVQRTPHGDQVPRRPVGIVLAQGAQLGPQDLVELTSLDVLGDLRLRDPARPIAPVACVVATSSARLPRRPRPTVAARSAPLAPAAGPAITLLVHPRSSCRRTPHPPRPLRR